MSAEPLAPEKQQYVEDMGLLFEEFGIPRMAGRILGWLLICPEPHQSSGEIAAVVGASSGSVSTMTRILVQLRAIERVAVPGERSGYFRVCRESMSEMMRAKNQLIGRFRVQAERGLAVLGPDDEPARARLSHMRDFYAFLEREFPALLERWQQEGR